MRNICNSFAMLSIVIISALALTPQKASAAGDDPATPEFYTAHVAPILQNNCAHCHSGLNHRGGFSIDSRESLLKGGNDGPVIVPGQPGQSLLVKLIHQTDLTEDQRPMPPRGKLTDAEIQTLEQWIKAGAIVPAPQQSNP